MGKTIVNIDLIKHYLDNYTVSAITHNGVYINTLTSNGEVIWVSTPIDHVVLDVAKITSDTYAGETTYTNESFVLLDIYPKAVGSSVRVTYGDLTKELTFTGTNAQQVFFGTFNGVSDEVDTPSSGRLTIEGEYKGFGVGGYRKSSSDKTSTANHCSCITSIVSMSGIEMLPSYAFYSCSSISSAILSDAATSIGEWAFFDCTSLTSIIMPDSVTSIGYSAFGNCTSLTSVRIPSSVTSINMLMFGECVSLESVIIPSSVTEIGTQAFRDCSSLVSITYQGTVEQWNAISKIVDSNSSWDQGTGDYIIYCTDGKIAKDGTVT